MTATPSAPRGFTLVEHSRYDEDVARVQGRLGRNLAEARCRLRFSRGLKFFVLHSDREPVAATWLVVDGERFIDEVGIAFRAGPDEAAVRDAYVAPEWRGRRLFAALMDGLVGRLGPATLWSDVSAENKPSLRAHQAYGFEVTGRYRALTLAGRLMVRLSTAAVPVPSTQYAGGGRLILLGRDYHQFVSDHLA